MIFLILGGWGSQEGEVSPNVEFLRYLFFINETLKTWNNKKMKVNITGAFTDYRSYGASANSGLVFRVV